jgi:hypothetical protein
MPAVGPAFERRQGSSGSGPFAPGRIEFTKWGGIPHWRFDAAYLGNDQHGAWFGAFEGVLLQRGDEPPIPWGCDFVVLVPQRGQWIACFNASGKYALYIDVTGPISFDGAVVRADDLDLDVVRMADGSVRLLDEDEFAEHQVRFGYPDEVVSEAQRTVSYLLRAVAAQEEPFGAAGPSWLKRLTATA